MTQPLSYLYTYDKGNNDVIFNDRYYEKHVEGDSYPWCAAFVWCIFNECGASDLFYDGKKTAYCPTIHQWGKDLRCPVRKANPYKRMAKAIKSNNVAQYILDRKFTEYGPRMVLLTDITYLPYNGTFAFLSTILYAFTRQVLSYVLSESLEVDFVLETVNLLIDKHGISLNAETLINSDQGSHYTCCSFIQLLKDKGLRQSMSHKGNCWDNAPQESFFGHMKDHIKERLNSCTEYSQVQLIVDDYIDYYNRERYQWQLAKLSPDEFYEFIKTGIYPLPIENAPSAKEFTHLYTSQNYI